MLGAAIVGGLASSFFGMPFDFIKTQMQKQVRDLRTGQLPYKSSFACIRATFKAGGIWTFYAGFPVYVMCIAPFQATSLLLRDKLKEHL